VVWTNHHCCPPRAGTLGPDRFCHEHVVVLGWEMYGQSSGLPTSSRSGPYNYPDCSFLFRVLYRRSGGSCAQLFLPEAVRAKSQDVEEFRSNLTTGTDPGGPSSSRILGAYRTAPAQFGITPAASPMAPQRRR